MEFYFIPNLKEFRVCLKTFTQIDFLSIAPVFYPSCKIHTAVFLNLFLQCLCKIFIPFICYNSQFIYITVKYPLAILIYRKTQTPADFLPLFDFRFSLIYCANLKDIRFVPSLSQCGMAKDKT